MSTFIFKSKNLTHTPVSNIFIDTYMPRARGEYVKVYLLGLKYCISGEPGVSSSIMASTLHLLETDVLNAWNYWNDENVIKLIPQDNMSNFSIDFLDLNDQTERSDTINLLHELDNTSIKDMLQDIEKLLSRPLSSKEMSMYIGWLKDYNFSPELVLLLIQYCSSKGKTDWRYIEKLSLCWFDEKILTVDDAQSFIKRHEDKWMNIRKILKYLGIKDADVMKPQEEMLSKWFTTYNFHLDVIYKACDLCFQRINKTEFKYIDGILTSWHKDGIKTVEDIAKRDIKKGSTKPPVQNQSFVKPSNSTFNNFEQREYDFEDLEKKLLGWYKE